MEFLEHEYSMKNTKNEPRSEYVTVCEMPFPDFPFFSMIRLSCFRCRRTLERWKMWCEQSMLLTMRHLPSHLSVCVLCHLCGFWLYHPLHLAMNCILWWKTTLHKSLFATWATPSLRTPHLGWSLFCLGVMFLKPFGLYFPLCWGVCFSSTITSTACLEWSPHASSSDWFGFYKVLEFLKNS